MEYRVFPRPVRIHTCSTMGPMPHTTIPVILVELGWPSGVLGGSNFHFPGHQAVTTVVEEETYWQKNSEHLPLRHYYRCEFSRMGSSPESRTLGYRLVKSVFKSKRTNSSPLGTVGIQGRNSRETCTCTHRKWHLLYSTSTIGGTRSKHCVRLILLSWAETNLMSIVSRQRIRQYSYRLIELATTGSSGVGTEPVDLNKINPEMGNDSSAFVCHIKQTEVLLPE